MNPQVDAEERRLTELFESVAPPVTMRAKVRADNVRLTRPGVRGWLAGGGLALAAAAAALLLGAPSLGHHAPVALSRPGGGATEKSAPLGAAAAPQAAGSVARTVSAKTAIAAAVGTVPPGSTIGQTDSVLGAPVAPPERWSAAPPPQGAAFDAVAPVRVWRVIFHGAFRTCGSSTAACLTATTFEVDVDAATGLVVGTSTPARIASPSSPP